MAVMTEHDPGMQEWFNSSHAYAVFPNVGKAGFGIGGAQQKFKYEAYRS